MAILALAGRISSGKDTVGKIIQYLKSTERCEKGILGKQHVTLHEWLSLENYHNNATAFASGWKVKKFAGKLKQVATLLTGVPLEKWEDQEFKASEMPSQWNYLKQMFENNEFGKDGYSVMPMTYREFLQRLGTEAMREGLHTNVWVNALFADYTELTEKWNSDGEATVTTYPNWLITDMRFPNEFEAVKERGGLCVRVERNNPQDGSIYGWANSTNHTSETALDSRKFDYVLNNSGTIDDLVVEVQKMISHFKLIP